MVFLKEFLKNFDFEKNPQMTYKQEKLPTMQMKITTGAIPVLTVCHKVIGLVYSLFQYISILLSWTGSCKNYHNFCAFQGSQTPELNFVKKKNLLSEEDEIDFIACCDSETFKFVVPPKKYKINIVLHALVSGPMCALCLWYLLPTTLNNIYYHNTGEC